MTPTDDQFLEDTFFAPAREIVAELCRLAPEHQQSLGLPANRQRVEEIARLAVEAARQTWDDGEDHTKRHKVKERALGLIARVVDPKDYRNVGHVQLLAHRDRDTTPLQKLEQELQREVDSRIEKLEFPPPPRAIHGRKTTPS